MRIAYATPALFGRDIESKADSVISTADSFKSWDTCMDNKTCKIVAIVGIVLAFLFFFFIISVIVNCCCCAVSCVENLFCCCKGSSRRQKDKGFVPMAQAGAAPQYASQVAPVYVPPQAYQRDFSGNQYRSDNPFAENTQYEHTKY